MNNTITTGMDLEVGRNWYYLTVLIDLFSRSLVGRGLSDSLERYSFVRKRG